jgi:hypothetical protein
LPFALEQEDIGPPEKMQRYSPLNESTVNIPEMGVEFPFYSNFHPHFSDLSKTRPKQKQKSNRNQKIKHNYLVFR